MSGTKPILSALIVNWNGGTTITKCVESVLRFSSPKDLEILVVDNGSTDGSLAALRRLEARHPSLRVIASGANLGFGRANNLAAREATSPLLLFVNPDVEFESDLAPGVVQEFNQHPDLGVLGLLVHDGEGDLDYNSGRRFPGAWSDFCLGMRLASKYPKSSLFNSGRIPRWDHLDRREVGVISGSLFAMPRDLFFKMGGFDNRQFMYFDEILLCRKAKDLGFKVVLNGTLRAIHRSGSLSKGQSKSGRLQSFEAQSGYIYYQHTSGLLRAELHAAQTAGVAILRAAALLALKRKVDQAAGKMLNWYLTRSIDIP
jgi:GT2 family glycosyltransferase